MNDFKECINTANYIADKITNNTGYKVALNKIKESTDPDDFYILYRMTINGQNYKLYAGDEDFTIAGEDNEIYIESDGFNTNRNIEYFCERIDGVNESMDFGEAKQILNENGYRLVEAVSYLGQAKQIAQRLGYYAFIDKDGTLVIHEDKRNIAEIDSIDYTDNYGKLRSALDNLGGATGHGVKYKISDDGMCLEVTEF